MADKNTPHPSTMADSDFSQDDLWLVSYADDDDRELNAMQIAAALERGEIDANTIVWRDGMPEWKAIAEVEGLRAQLRRLSNAPENLRRRQTQLGGFGPVQPASARPAAPPAAPGLSLDDDEPTIIQSSVMDGFSSAPNHVRPEASLQRGRHPTSGNTLRIKTGEPPQVAPVPEEDRITPNDFSRHAAAARLDSSPRAAAASEPDLESLPSALLVTATNAIPVSHKPGSGAPPVPTRGVMSRQSDPPGTPIGSSIPRAALTREPDSDAPPPPRRGQTDAPKPPVPRRAAGSEPESLPPEAVKSVVSTPSVSSEPARPRRVDAELPSVQVRDEDADLSRQRTRPPRSRREGWVESGTPPPIGELSDAAARIAQATSHPPSVPAREKPSSAGKWVGLALFGVAAVAGAFTLGKRSGEQESHGGTPVVANPGGLATVGAPAVSSFAAEPGAEEPPPEAVGSAIVANEPASEEPSEAKATGREVPARSFAAVTPRAEPKPATKVPATPSPAGPSPAATAMPTPHAPAETPPPPGPNDKPSTPGAFDASAAAAALGAAASRASSCRQPGDPSGVARVTVTFTNGGNATHAIVDGPPFAGTATGGCIASTMRSATVPPFTGDRVTVKKTVIIQ